MLPGPALLDPTSSPTIEASARLRQLAIEAFVQATAKYRVRRSLKTNPTLAAERMDLNNNDKIDFFRKPAVKDQPAWIGPATIVDLSDIERGYVGAKYNNRLLTLNTQDVRHHHSYLADLVATPVYSNLLRHIRRSLTSLPPGKLQFIFRATSSLATNQGIRKRNPGNPPCACHTHRFRRRDFTTI